jgi:membrane associated rhomboid family serine protease
MNLVHVEDETSKRKPSIQSTFERLFYQKRQASNTTAETTPMEASVELNRRKSQQAVDSPSDTASSSLGSSVRHYSVSELVASLGAVDNDVDLPPALERRVRDFRFAQAKRRERHGDQKPWGIYGLYAHLSDIRADLEWAEDAAWRRQRGQPYLSWRDFDKGRDKGLHNRPLFTYAAMALCTIMMVVTFGVNGWKFEPLNVNPLIGPSSETLIRCGARDTNLIVNEGQWYRLFTPMILHAGLVHFFFNMMALYFIGGAVESSHGFASAAVLFIIPAVGGNILSAICLPQYISVGASGGIFGLIGGCIADICLNWNLLFLKTTTDKNTRLRHFYVLLWLGIDIIVNCLLGFTPFVDNFTHLGGFMYGFCCGISTIERLAVGFFGVNTDKCSRLGSNFMRFFGLIVSIIAIMVTTVVLVQSDGVTSPCHGCRYISCVPFPPNAEEKWWYCDDCDVVTADLFRAGEGEGLYEQINIHCPNGEVEEIVIADENIEDKEVLRRALPAYCRAHCNGVFASSN